MKSISFILLVFILLINSTNAQRIVNKNLNLKIFGSYAYGFNDQFIGMNDSKDKYWSFGEGVKGMIQVGIPLSDVFSIEIGTGYFYSLRGNLSDNLEETKFNIQSVPIDLGIQLNVIWRSVVMFGGIGFGTEFYTSFNKEIKSKIINETATTEYYTDIPLCFYGVFGTEIKLNKSLELVLQIRHDQKSITVNKSQEKIGSTVIETRFEKNSNLYEPPPKLSASTVSAWIGLKYNISQIRK